MRGQTLRFFLYVSFRVSKSNGSHQGTHRTSGLYTYSKVTDGICVRVKGDTARTNGPRVDTAAIRCPGQALRKIARDVGVI